MYRKSLILWLQVRNLSGEWIYAKPVPGTFVCNIGDMLKVSSSLSFPLQTSLIFDLFPNSRCLVTDYFIWFQVWSNGIYQPTLHRVVNNSPRYRVSVAFFYEVCIRSPLSHEQICDRGAYAQHSCFPWHVQSNFDAAVEPVEFCREKTGSVAKYERVVYGEHLVQKVLTNFVM